MGTSGLPAVDRELLRFAVRVGCQAGRIAVERFHRFDERSERKQDGSVVTEADRVIEEMMCSEFAQYTPDDGVLGEERGAHPGQSGRRWVVDPIDGTRFFTRRIPVFTNLIAYEDEHGVAIGVVNMPMQREMVFAGRGLGCWLLRGVESELERAVPVCAGNAHVLGEAVVHGSHTYTWTADFAAALHSQCLLQSNRGDDAYGVAMVVTGRADALVSVHTGKPWDWAPIPIIAREAGVVATDLRGDLLPGDGSGLVANSVLHAQLLAATTNIRRVRPWRSLADRPTRSPDEGPPK
jgi:histidinol-phosphatase